MSALLVADQPRGPGCEPARRDDEPDGDGDHDPIVITAGVTDKRRGGLLTNS